LRPSQRAGASQAAGGKAVLGGGGVVAVEYGDGMAVGGQFVSGGDADDAGAHDGDLHGFRYFWLAAQ